MELKITPSGQTIVKPTALGPGANTDTKLLIYGLFQKGRVLAQDEEHDPMTDLEMAAAGTLRAKASKRLDTMRAHITRVDTARSGACPFHKLRSAPRVANQA